MIRAVLLLFALCLAMPSLAATFAVVAKCNGGRVARYNVTDDETYAAALVDRLQNGTAYPEYNFPDALSPEDLSASAYYSPLSLSSETEDYSHRPTFWDCDGSTVTFNLGRLIDRQRSIGASRALREAAARESAGITVSGVNLRTDTAGISKLHGLMISAQRKEAASQAVNIRGRTRAGVKIVITSAAQAEAMFDAASGHVEAVQAALDDLMDEIDVMTLIQLKALDVATWWGWP